MDSPLIRATMQSTLLSALSNVLGQLIGCRQSKSPYSIDIHDLAAFVTFSLISCPPNYIWQAWLEATFPGYTESLRPQEKEKLVDEVVAGHASGTDTGGHGELKPRDEKKGAITSSSVTTDISKVKKKLNIRNTIAKFLLDQTLGAWVNTVLFIVGIALLQGRSLEQGIQECKQGFWPLVFAAQKLWPLVSVISLTLIPVERRMVFSSIIGVGWGIFLSLLSGGKGKDKHA